MLSGPMFEPANSVVWRSCFGKDGAHYNVFSAARGVDLDVGTLRRFFPDGEADEMNFVLFSTSGVHGTYRTIEDAEARIPLWREGKPDPEDPDGEAPSQPDVTFLLVHPRIVCLRYGNVLVSSQEDIDFLKKLRASSWAAVQKIGAPDPAPASGEGK